MPTTVDISLSLLLTNKFTFQTPDFPSILLKVQITRYNFSRYTVMQRQFSSHTLSYCNSLQLLGYCFIPINEDIIDH
jgi:hypothetical protein